MIFKTFCSGVDHRLCLGVLKRIIPAVASTNAVVAGWVLDRKKLFFGTIVQLTDNF